MCYAVIKVKYNLDKEAPSLKEMESKVQLEKELKQLESIGTVAEVTVFLNHHKHRMVKTWVDELYKEPENEVSTAS